MFVSLQAEWIGLVVILCSVLQVTSDETNVFMGRYNGQLRRDYIFEQIHFERYGTKFQKADDETTCSAPYNTKITVGHYDQPLDQFDKSNEKKWGQHYQINDKFFNKTASSHVVFLLLGGEGPMTNKWVCEEGLTYMGLAKTYNALVIQLEHRFFGANTGLDDLSVANLKYLTTKQALADVNEFMKWVNSDQKLQSPRWVVFGGSYPGTMAAIFKRDYPNSVQGAISSSSVFGPKVDLWEYAWKMESVINETEKDVPGCYNAIQASFSDLQTKLLDTNGRTTLKTDLGLSADLGADIRSIQTVQFLIFDAFQGIFQYTYDGRSVDTEFGHRLTVNNLCKTMTSGRSSTQRLGDVFKLSRLDDTATINPSYDDLISPWKITTDGSKSDGTRGWLWLQCSQFGYLQSTSNNGVFGNVVPISFLTSMCNDLFGLNITTIENNVHDAVAYFGHPWDFNATNVAFPIGGLDPWSMLATNVSDSSKRLANHVTPGVGHCGDMYVKYNGEPSGLDEVRKFVAGEVDYYLSLPSTWGNTPPDTQATTTPGSFSPTQGACTLLFVFSALLHFMLRN